MILRFCSGSVTPSRAARNSADASTTCSLTPVAATKSCSTCSASPLRSSPWSTNTQVSRSPMARCTRAAATAESTPPDSPQIARPPPTCSLIRSVCSSTMFSIVHVGRHPAASRNRRRILVPYSVCITSGWNCTPYRPRSGSSTAAAGVAAVCAVTVNPGGAAVEVSPCDIQTLSSGPSPARSRPASGRTSAACRRTRRRRSARPCRRARGPAPGARSRCRRPARPRRTGRPAPLGAPSA